MKITKQKNENIQRQQQKIVIDLVAVLGIFSGIMMTFIGAFQLFQISIGNLTKQNDFKVLFCICIVAFVFFNTLVLFIHVISKFGTGLESSPSKHKLIARIRRYPFVFIINFVLVILIFMCGFLYIGDVIDISQYWTVLPHVHNTVY